MSGLKSNMDGELGKRDLSDLIWMVLDTNPKRLIGFSALATSVEGLVLGIILCQTTRYLTNFGRTDPLWAVIAILLGAAVLFAQLAMNLWQTYALIDKAATDLLSIVVSDIRCNMTVVLFIGILNFIAAGFFGRRAWLLSKKKIWLLIPLSIGILSSLGLSLGVAIRGYALPSLAGSPTPEDLAKYDLWRKNDNRLIVIWAAIALVQDVFVCALMTVMLLREKSGLQETEHGLLKLLIKLTYETMAGPVFLNVINVIVIAMQGATFADHSRLITWILGPVYFSSILQSLKYTKDVQRILRVIPTPRTASKEHRGTLHRIESPSIPLTSTISTRQTQHVRYGSLAGASVNTTERSPTLKEKHPFEIQHFNPDPEMGKRVRTDTIGSMQSALGEGESTIVLGGEGEKHGPPA
ncbi:uncharacterized protein I303_102235 [Kwoniella dejecticola CBS 10117]|uniref:Integral membrane protein n=1 Tax=Kwoniella dejecticola CBS 10117 TaxID=1296121 RepID=A0A1A6ABJ7_9TREE|nr:uncharacterized protein I303_01626 [Kwoniella dejecticola CBS 10117]OBR87424.1 hypothetical protein I303_01626 [Kwoniella dejecticola CBS 10117]